MRLCLTGAPEREQGDEGEQHESLHLHASSTHSLPFQEPRKRVVVNKM